VTGIYIFIVQMAQRYLGSSTNTGDIGESITYNITTVGTYYIRVHKMSGNSSSNYKLYAQTTGVTYNYSFYVENPTSSSYMQVLGRDYAYNISAPVILHFGQADKSGTDYGVWSFAGSHITFSQIQTAVSNFIIGYNVNPKHTNSIQILVAISNYKGTSLANTTDYTNMGTAFKNGISSISVSGYVNAIYGAFDAEMDWNSN
jgi:hypothetical protein